MNTKRRKNIWHRWDLNPRQWRLEPKSSALDHSATTSAKNFKTYPLQYTHITLTILNLLPFYLLLYDHLRPYCHVAYWRQYYPCFLLSPTNTIQGCSTLLLSSTGWYVNTTTVLFDQLLAHNVLIISHYTLQSHLHT